MKPTRQAIYEKAVSQLGKERVDTIIGDALLRAGKFVDFAIQETSTDETGCVEITPVPGQKIKGSELWYSRAILQAEVDMELQKVADHLSL